VIQQVGLFPHQTVAENVATVPRLAGWDARRTTARVHELLDLVALPADKYGKRLPAELSGGERQRVGVARALAVDPLILLMDEPFGAIDPIARDRLQEELLRLQGIVRKTIVFVTHDVDEAIRLGDRVAVFSQGGVLEQYARPSELLARPATPFVESFLGSTRMVRRLSLFRLRDVKLPPLDGAPRPDLEVDSGATLRDAFDAVLRASDGRISVVEAGQQISVLDADRLREVGRL
jgi:osmoprotectant transport system ATP-binding protein